MRRASGLRCRCCEVPLPTDAARCPSCGAEQQPSMFLPAPDAPGAVTVAMPRRRRPLGLIAVAVAVVALGIALVLMQPGGSNPPAAAPAPAAAAPTTKNLARVPGGIPR